MMKRSCGFRELAVGVTLAAAAAFIPVSFPACDLFTAGRSPLITGGSQSYVPASWSGASPPTMQDGAGYSTVWITDDWQ